MDFSHLITYVDLRKVYGKFTSSMQLTKAPQYHEFANQRRDGTPPGPGYEVVIQQRTSSEMSIVSCYSGDEIETKNAR